jgi:hypothetical protein
MKYWVHTRLQHPTVNLAILPTLSYPQVIFSSVNLPSEEHKMQGYSGVVLQKRYVPNVTTIWSWRGLIIVSISAYVSSSLPYEVGGEFPGSLSTWVTVHRSFTRCRTYPPRSDWFRNCACALQPMWLTLSARRGLLAPASGELLRFCDNWRKGLRSRKQTRVAVSSFSRDGSDDQKMLASWSETET